MRDQDYRARILEDLSSGSFSSDAELFKIASLDVNSSRTTSVRAGQYVGVSHPPSCDYGEYEEYYEASRSNRDNGVFTYASASERDYYSEEDSYVSDGSPSRYSHGTSDDVFTYSSSHYPGSAYSGQDSISYAPARHNQARDVNRPSALPPRPNRQILACHATTTATKPAGSLLSPFFQCVNPTLPGEMGVPEGTPMRQKVSTMNALRSNDDALDSIFNAVERMSCRDESTLLQRNTKIATPHIAIATPHIVRAPPTPETIAPKSVPKKADVVVQKKDDRDSLDVVFDGVERFACGVDPVATSKINMQSRVAPQQRTLQQQQQPQPDALDHVFEGVERMTCGANNSIPPTPSQSQSQTLTRQQRQQQQQKQDGLNRLFESAEHYTGPGGEAIQKRTQQPRWKYGNQANTNQTTQNMSQTTATPRDPPAFKLEKKKNAGNDVLDHFGNGFEYAVCRGNPAMVGKEGDMLDRVFDRFEANTCRQGNHSDGMDASYHSLDSTEFNNSIVERVPSRHSRQQNHGSYRSQPVEERLPPPTTSRQHNRASPQNRGTFQPDVLDLVFENVEAGLCRPSNKRGDRQRAKDLLERTRALRLQVEADADFE